MDYGCNREAFHGVKSRTLGLFTPCHSFRKPIVISRGEKSQGKASRGKESQGKVSGIKIHFTLVGTIVAHNLFISKITKTDILTKITITLYQRDLTLYNFVFNVKVTF